jgi:hypothetical protein
MKEIELSKTGRKYKGLYVTWVDDDIFDYLNQWDWYVFVNEKRKTQYVYRKEYPDGNQKTIFMHQVVCEYFKIEILEDSTPDHANGNGLDNQKNNLRPATLSEQNANRRIRINNTSGIIGVYWSEPNNKWRAQVRIRGIKTHLGYFSSKEEAKNVRDAAVKEYYGKFGVLND